MSGVDRLWLAGMVWLAAGTVTEVFAAVALGAGLICASYWPKRPRNVAEMDR